MPKIALLNIGNELLKGSVVNTNASFVGKALKKNGFQLSETIVIPDIPETIRSFLLSLKSKVDFVIITGGLGPTSDDVTKKVICDLLETDLVEDSQSMKRLKFWYAQRGRELNPLSAEQALVPRGGEVFQNNMGTAPGLFHRWGKCHLVCLPGVPQEMKHLIIKDVIPKISTLFKGKKMFTRVIHTYGKPESEIAQLVEEVEQKFQEKVTLAFLPENGGVKVELESYEESFINDSHIIISTILKDHTFSIHENDTLEKSLLRLLSEKGLSLGLAESCTGGSVASTITQVSGASQVFKGGIVCYTNESKVNLLNVNPETIEKFSAASPETALELSIGARMRFQCDIAISITGTAEIQKEDEVYSEPKIHFSYSDKFENVQKTRFFRQDRQSNIKNAVNYALWLAFKKVQVNFA